MFVLLANSVHSAENALLIMCDERRADADPSNRARRSLRTVYLLSLDVFPFEDFCSYFFSDGRSSGVTRTIAPPHYHWNHRTVVSNCMKSTHSFHRHKSLSHELRSERASERMSAAERASEASSAEQASDASERANGGANDPVLNASISSSFYPSYPTCACATAPVPC